jgi:hypothetical protein
VLKRRWQNMEVLTVHPMKVRVGDDDYDDVTCLFKIS